MTLLKNDFYITMHVPILIQAKFVTRILISHLKTYKLTKDLLDFWYYTLVVMKELQNCNRPSSDFYCILT